MFFSICTAAPIVLSLALLSLTSYHSVSKGDKTSSSHMIDLTDAEHVEVAAVSVQILPDL